MTADETEDGASDSAQQNDDAEAKRIADSEKLLSDVAAGRLDRVEQRVAWLLNQWPDARNSDVTLLIHYWTTFDDSFDRGNFVPESLYELTRMPTVVRARARIQNQLRLFQASSDVRAARGTLADDEKSKPRSDEQPSHPLVSVFLDETGKNDENLIVGGLWSLNGIEERYLTKETRLWLQAQEWPELHFVKISSKNVDAYIDYLSVLKKRFSTFGFKFVALKRAGDVQRLLGQMFYYLISEGVAHEHESRRAPLPRRLAIWKDAEDQTFDQIVLADIRDRLLGATAGRFQDGLELADLRAVSSKDNPLIQICDLFLSSVNRCLNGSGLTGEHPKDRFARTVLNDYSIDISGEGTIDDIACRLHI
jgi:hypothetical protein